MSHNAMFMTVGGLSLFYNDKMRVVGKDHAHYSKILDAVNDDRWNEIDALIDLVGPIRDWFSAIPDVRVVGSIIQINGEPCHQRASEFVLGIVNSGLNPTPFVNTLRKLLPNSAASVHSDLFPFLEVCRLLVCQDGDFLAYKRVRNDYTDIYTGKISNAIGEIVTVQRRLVDDNRGLTCSFGLHAAALDYAKNHYSSHQRNDRLVVVKINPVDVVAIPNDHNNQKLRCCRYEVVGELPAPWAQLPENRVYPVNVDPVVAGNLPEPHLHVLNQYGNIQIHPTRIPGHIACATRVEKFLNEMGHDYNSMMYESSVSLLSVLQHDAKDTEYGSDIGYIEDIAKWTADGEPDEREDEEEEEEEYDREDEEEDEEEEEDENDDNDREQEQRAVDAYKGRLDEASQRVAERVNQPGVVYDPAIPEALQQVKKAAEDAAPKQMELHEDVIVARLKDALGKGLIVDKHDFDAWLTQLGGSLYNVDMVKALYKGGIGRWIE